MPIRVNKTSFFDAPSKMRKRFMQLFSEDVMVFVISSIFANILLTGTFFKFVMALNWTHLVELGPQDSTTGDIAHGNFDVTFLKKQKCKLFVEQHFQRFHNTFCQHHLLPDPRIMYVSVLNRNKNRNFKYYLRQLPIYFLIFQVPLWSMCTKTTSWQRNIQEGNTVPV